MGFLPTIFDMKSVYSQVICIQLSHSQAHSCRSVIDSCNGVCIVVMSICSTMTLEGNILLFVQYFIRSRGIQHTPTV